MHLLLADYQKPQRSLFATIVSVVLHGGIVVVLALSGQQVVRTVAGLIEQTVQYLYPPPRDIGRPRPGEAMDAAGAGLRSYGTSASLGAAGANTGALSARTAHDGIEWVPIPFDGASVEPGVGDNALSVVDVDSIAVMDPTSAAPSYPESLVLRHVEGGAVFRFVIDSTGLIDMATARVMSATHKLFAQSVIEAMPKMKFRPARVGSHAVRLLVEQSFSFKIQRTKEKVS
jgi:TonB family protein